MDEREFYLERKRKEIKSKLDSSKSLIYSFIAFALCYLWKEATSSFFSWFCLIISGICFFIFVFSDNDYFFDLVGLLFQSDDDYIKQEKEADEQRKREMEAERQEELQEQARRQEFEREKGIALSTPEVYIQSPNMSSLRCAFMEKNKSIERFIYGNGFIDITMRDGSHLDGKLHEISVKFEKLPATLIEAYVSNYHTSIHFYKYDEQFNSSQWNQIFEVLCSAGNTSGTYLFGNMYKGLKYLNTAAKVISKLS